MTADPARISAEDELLDVLQRFWGYSGFRPHQRQAMLAVLSGRDTVVVLPTGGGKSLCYQAPALLGDGLALVVSPLISLMKDQVDALTANGVPAAFYNSSLGPEERRHVARRVADGEVRLLYVSPERLAGDGSERFLSFLRSTRPRYVAIDEAHCISHWGHDFRPEYRQLGRLKEELPGVSLHAFTATATPRVRSDIVEQLGLADPAVLIGSFDRPNLVYRVQRRANLLAQVRRVLDRHPGEGGIIYCLARRDVDDLARRLRELGYSAVPYHAGLPSEERRRNQEAFVDERADVVVATVAFGMGIDRSNVRFVLHAAAPRSLEHYQQETGRAGRDGLPADCTLLYSPSDFIVWRKLLESNGRGTDEALALLAHMRRYAAQVTCRHRALVEYFGQQLEGSDCGACDVCMGELEPVDDATELAQKILSCVVRVGQRWGVGHVTDVLRGSKGERVRSQGHDRLSTFGLLEGMPMAELRGYIEQLIDQGLLLQEGDRYPVLAVAPAGWELLRSERECSLFRQPKPKLRRGKRRPRRDDASWEGVDSDLFDALRALRSEIAAERGVPPYVIFHDRTLREMARLKPTTVFDLHEIYGIGDKKAADYGPRFLARISHTLSS